MDDPDLLLWDGLPMGYWVQALGDPDDETRWRAVDALRHIGDPSETIPLFVGTLKDRYWRARALAAHALFDMAFDEELVPLLSEAVIPLANVLSDESLDVALNAANTLEVLGPRARAALPQLEHVVESPQLGREEVRQVASSAILKIRV
jgi:HEAT repeat protein